MLRKIWDKVKWFLIGFLLFSLMGLPLMPYYIIEDLKIAPNVWVHLISFILNCLVIIFLSYRLKAYQFLKSWQPCLTWKFWGIVVGLLVIIKLIDMLGLMVIEWQGGALPENEEAVQAMMQNLHVVNTILSGAVLAPLTEEMVFRGIFFKKLFPKFTWVALVVSSLLFGLLHGPTDFGSWLIYAGSGLVFGWIYYKTDNLSYSLVVHVLNNLIAIVALFFMP